MKMTHKLQWKLILIFILFIFAVMLMSSTFMLTSVSSYYLNRFKVEMDTEFTGQLGTSLNDCFSAPDRTAKINEIMEVFGLTPCKEVGSLKSAIKDAILDGVIPNEHDAAFAFMLERAKKMGLKPKA